jgi:hypothetical protein
MFLQFCGVELFVGRDFVARDAQCQMIEVAKTPDGFESVLFKRYYIAVSYVKGEKKNGSNETHNGNGSSIGSS